MSRLNARLGALALSCAALAACPAAAGSSSTQADADTAAYDRTLSKTLDSEVRNAQIQRAQGDFSGAIRTLSQLMLASPDDPRVVGEYGKVLVQQGRAAEAVQFLSRAVELQPNDWTLYSALGVAYDQTGDAANARIAYDRALVLKPGEAVVLNNYAMSRMQAGDLAEAHRLLSQAAAAGSGNPQIARNLTLLQGLGAVPAQTPVAAPTIAGGTPKLIPYTEMTRKPLPATSDPVANHAPKPLLATSTPAQSKVGEPQTIVMQEVPVDPKAGRVRKKVTTTNHPPVKTAAVPKPAVPKLAEAPKLRSTPTPNGKTTPASSSASNKIPSLRLADDHS